MRLGAAFLSSKAPDLRYCHPSNAQLRQSLLNSLKLEGFDHGFDLFHCFSEKASTVPDRPNQILGWIRGTAERCSGVRCAILKIIRTISIV